MKITKMNEDTVLMEGTVAEGMFSHNELRTMLIIEEEDKRSNTVYKQQLEYAITTLDKEDYNND
jgi:hypothetical protein